MKRRRLEMIGLAVVFVAVSLLLKVTQASVQGVNQTRPDETATAGPVPMTSWGDPDLAGIWNHIYATTLQRPAGFAGRELLTDEEREAWDKRRAAAPRQNDPGIAKRGTEQDVSGAYNAVFTSLRPTSPRTSLIVDPSNGRLPPATAETQKRRAEYPW